MLTLGFGQKRPENGDTGEAFFPALETNIQNLYAVLGLNATVASGSWGADLGGGTYRQTITLPTAMTDLGFVFDDIRIQARDANGEACHPRIDRQSDTTFHIYTNDNSVVYTLGYSV